MQHCIRVDAFSSLEHDKADGRDDKHKDYTTTTLAP